MTIDGVPIIVVQSKMGEAKSGALLYRRFEYYLGEAYTGDDYILSIVYRINSFV